MEDQKQPEQDQNRKGPIASGIAPGPGERLADAAMQSGMAASRGNEFAASTGPATPGGQNEREWRWPRSEAVTTEYGGAGESPYRSRTMLESAGERVSRSRGTFVVGAVVAGFLLQRFLQTAPAQAFRRHDRMDVAPDASFESDREYGLESAYAPEFSASGTVPGGSTTNRVTDRVRQAGDDARMRLRAKTADAKARLRDMGEVTRDRYYRAKGRVDTVAQEQPLLIGALGLAVGAGLGAMLATTRRENELLGDMRDKVVAKARETASSQMQTVKDSARRVADIAKEEAERKRAGSSSAASGGRPPGA